MSFTSNEKSYGGYSSFSPMRHAEKDEENKPTKDQEYVHDKAEEIMGKQKEKDEGKAWAVAWSILCKYKNPSSPHCKKEKGDYFPSRKAYSSNKERMKARTTAIKISSTLDKLVSKALLHISRIIKANTRTERELKIVYYLWTHGKFPSFMLKYGVSAKILGEIAGDTNYEERPEEVTNIEERSAYLALYKICLFCHVKWESRVWAKLWVKSGDVPFDTIRIEMLRHGNRIKRGPKYTRLIRHLFGN